MEFIAIDIGTSFTKGAIVDSETLTMREVRRQPSPAPMVGSHVFLQEYAPLKIVESVSNVVGKLLPLTDACRGILLTGQMGGLIFCSEDGRALSPYISWLDRRATLPHPQRAGTFMDGLADEVGDRIQTVLGNEFRPGLPLSFLYYLREVQQLEQYDGAIPVALPDYVAAAMCRSRPVMERTNACGLLDIRTGELAVELFDELKLGKLNWPGVVDFRTCVGEYQAAGRSLGVFAATGDHQCSLAGTLIVKGELSVNISTGSQLSMLTDSTDVGDFQVRPYFDGAFLKTITNIPAGRALSAIMKLLTEMPAAQQFNMKQAWRYFFDQAEATVETDVAVNLAFFPGAISGPGSFGNLREDNLSVGHVARACLQQMADYYDLLAGQLVPARDWSGLVFSGGIAQQSRLLKQLISARLSAGTRSATSSEDALSGMMVLGRVIGGLNSTVAEATEYIAGKFDSNPHAASD